MLCGSVCESMAKTQPCDRDIEGLKSQDPLVITLPGARQGNFKVSNINFILISFAFSPIPSLTFTSFRVRLTMYFQYFQPSSRVPWDFMLNMTDKNINLTINKKETRKNKK